MNQPALELPLEASGLSSRRALSAFLEMACEMLRQSQEARRQARRFQTLIESSRDLIAVMDRGGAFLYQSQSILKMLGPVATLFESLHPEDRALMQGAIQDVLDHPGRVAPAEARLKVRDGSWRTFEGEVRNQSHEPSTAGIVIHWRDITERRGLEAQLQQSQKMEAIGTLAGGIAHDFNNLLTAISGYTELSLDVLPSDCDVREMLLEVKRAAESAATLTGRLLAFSRRQVVHAQILDLNAVVADLEKMLRRLLGEGIDVATTMAADLGRIKGDRGQVEQILMNLVVNAKDAMNGRGHLAIETCNLDHGDPDGQVVLSVADDGCGMDAATVSRIFEPFYTTKPLGQGTGLGLSVVYGIVQQSHGRIEVSSRPGQGTTFRIILPRVMDGAPEAVVPPPASCSDGCGETIMVVEDDAVVRAMISRILEASGYRLLQAPGPDEALDISTRHEGVIHLTISDVFMPRMYGPEMARRLAEKRPDMKLLFISGYTGPALAQQGVLEDGVAFMAKPFHPHDLTRKVREVLGFRARGAGVDG